LSIGILVGVEFPFEKGKGLIISHTPGKSVLVQSVLLEFEFSLELVGLVMNTDNRSLEIEVPDLVVGERLGGLGIDFDESISRTIRGLVHESIVWFVKEYLVVDGISLLLIRAITVVIS
jgi:hypothetical protein